MRLLRLQYCLIALVILTFVVCMLVAISFISDRQFLKSPFEDLSHPDVLGTARATLNPANQQSDILGKPKSNLSIPLLKVLANDIKLQRTNRINMSSTNADNPDIAPERCEETLNENQDLLTVPNYKVHVFYYPWYGNPSVDGRYLHWNHRFLPHWKPEVAEKYPSGQHIPPDDIGASFYPRLGPYSSRDPVVIDDHMRQIRLSGAGVLSVSWYPPGDADDEGFNVDAVIPLLLDAASKYSLKICLHIEPYNGRSDVTLRKNLEYIMNQYGNHSSFYRWPSSNLPVYYIYDSYKVSEQMWTSLLSLEGTNTVRGTAIDGVFIGLVVERTHVDQLIRCGFDGFYTYFATDGFTYGSTNRNWGTMARIADQKRVIFVPSVGPGYDDTPIRPWNSENSRDRLHGLYYERSFAEAVKVGPAAVSVTSFNEWGEGTQIEEAVPKKTEDRTYLDYQPGKADFYLRLTRKWSCRLAFNGDAPAAK